MKRFLLILALWLSIVAGAVAQTAKPNILIITGYGTIEKEIADKMEAELTDRYNITRHSTGSIALEGFTQIYDLRININDHDYPLTRQREAFLKFLNAAKGNSLFLLGGPMSNYNLRGVRINSFITEAGGGPVKDIQNDNATEPEILKAPFASGPNSLTTISLGEKGGTPPLSGTGTYLSTHSDGTPGCGLYFAQNTLTNAPNGCLVVLYSIALMRDNDALRANIEHVMAAGGTLPGPTASSISLSVTPNPTARSSKVTYTATVTPGATGSVMFKRGNAENLVSLNSNGTATYVGNTLPYAGTISMTAQYYGDANYNPSGKETVNVVVCGTPMYPTGVTATAGDGQATVSFTPPTSDGGAPIISYTVTASPGNITATGTSSPITVTGLTNGTAYTFKVKASNGPNTSMDSPSSNSITPMHTSVVTYPTEAPYGTAIGEGALSATADVPGTFDYTPAKGTMLNVGNNQALTVTFTPTDKGNTTASKALTVNVTKAQLAISEPTVTTTKEYDGSNVATITSPGEVSGIVAEASDVRVIADAQFDDANAGTGKTITVTYTLEGANSSCYLAPAPRTLTGEIKPKEITVTPNINQKRYGDTDPYYSYDLEPTYDRRQITGRLSRAEGENVGSYRFTIGDLQPTSSNYKFTLAEAYFNIVQKQLSWKFSSEITKAYDGTTKGTTLPSIVGIIPGDDASVAITASYYDKNVGTGKTVDFSFAISGAHAGNYKLPSFYLTTAAITPASLTVTPNNIDKRVEKVYSFAGTEFTTSGLFEGDELTSVTLTSDGAAASAALGSYDIEASNAQGTGLDNYSISYNKGKLTVIDKIDQTISFTNPGAQLYGTAPTLSATASSGLPVTFTTTTSDVCTITSGGALSFVAAGTCTVEANQAGNADYKAAPPVSQSFEVTPLAPSAPISVSATAGDEQASVNFFKLPDDSGAPITSYTVTANPGGHTATGTRCPIVVNGLTNGTEYTFTVTASNIAKESAPSEASAPVTPFYKPNVLVVSNNQWDEKGAAQQLLMDLTKRFDVTVSTTGIPASLDGYAQIYDVRVTESITSSDATLYTDFLRNNPKKSLFLAGECLWFKYRNQSISSFIQQLGGGTIAPPVAESDPKAIAVKVPFNAGTSSISTTFLDGYGIVTESGKGSFIGTEANGTSGAGLYFPQGTLANAPKGSLVVMYDITFLASAASYNYEFRMNLEQVIAAGGTLPGPSASTISLNGTPNPTAKRSPVTFTATVTPGATGEVQFSEDGIVLENVTIDNGVATYSYPSIGLGERSIKAKYIGDASYNSSTSEVFKLNVYDVPDAPTIGTATAGDGQATVSFTPPTYDGGLPITGYTVTSTPGNITATGTSSPITVTGLANGTEYTFTVTTSNAVGTGAASAVSNSIKPMHTSVITWSNPADITYGTALGDAQLNATADVPGTFTYTPAAGTVLNAGNGQALTATFTPDDKGNTTESKTLTINVAKALLTVTASSHTITKGEAIPGLSVSYSGFVNGEDESVLDTKPTATTVATVASPVGEYVTRTTGGIDGNYEFAYVDGKLAILDKRIPAVTWAEPTAITYGTALTDAQMNATASYSTEAVAGTFTYAPAAGTTLAAGKHDLKVTFTPTDGDHYISVEKTVSLTVNKALLTVTANRCTITKGETIPALSVSYSGFVNGEDEAVLDTKPTATSTASAKSNAGVYDINVTEGSDNNYFFSYIIGTLEIKKITTTISWEVPAAITYGTKLGDAQLSATADAEGTLTYVPAEGTVLAAGKHDLKVTFTPTDAVNYSSMEKTVSLTVSKAMLTATASSYTITKGENIPTLGITYKGFVNGEDESVLDTKPTATTAATDASDAGTYDIVAANGADGNYELAYVKGTLTIGKITPTISWDTPATITYGTKLGDAQLTATADAPGTFTYAPAAGTVLNAGLGQTLSVTFTPNDKVNYKEVKKTVAISIAKAPLTVTATSYTITKGEDIPTLGITYKGFVYGEDESVLDTMPNATTTATDASDAGTYDIVPADGADGNYELAYVKGTLTIGKITPAISWATPATITYGTKLGDAQLSATADAPGTFTYAPAAGTVLNAGLGQTLCVTFTPNDKVNYKEVTKTVAISVAKAPLTATASSHSITKGETIPTLGVTYEGFVNGEDESVLDTKPNATTTATNASDAGTYDIVAANGADNNYELTYVKGTLTIGKITPTISWATPAAITYGTALGDAQLSATADAPGTFAYVPAAGTVLNAGQGQTLSVTFTPNDKDNYNEVKKTVAINVNKAPLTVTASSYTITKGEDIPILGVTYKGFVNGEDESVLDTKPTATTAATDASDAGAYDIVATNGADGNYELAYVNGKLVILDKRIPTVTWAEPAAITYGTVLTNEQLNATASYSEAAVEGTFTYTPALGTTLAAGKHELKVAFTPSDEANYVSVEKIVSLNVNKALLTATANSYSIREGEDIPALTVTYSGFVNGEDDTVLDTKPTATTTATSTSSSGVYDITVAGGADDNYEFAYVAGTLTVSNPIVVDALQAPQSGCEGDRMNLTYTLTSGRPTEYQIVFDAKALAAGFNNSDYTALPSDNGTVSFSIPTRVADGIYQASLLLRDDYGNISEPEAFHVTVNVSADIIVTKFGNVVLIDNHEGRFTGYQWYKNGSAIGGATNQYYKDPNGLSGTYYAQLKTATGQTLNTCTKALSLKKSAQASVSVYPNPARAGQEITVKLAGFADEELQGSVLSVFSTQGVPVYTSRKVEVENRITLSDTDGVYMGRITTADGQVLTFKVVLAN